MENIQKTLLPPPSFGKPKEAVTARPHFLTPSGMTLLPREKQPPPMYGPRGSTVPGRFLGQKQYNGTKEPAANPFQRQFCEACEMELQSEEDMRQHRLQHQRCPVDGCTYRGLPMVMDKHVTALHSSGIFDKLKKLCTPEEIAAWREERRKRYPTVANVQMRQKAREQREKRGERLETKQHRFGNREDRKRVQNRDVNKNDANKPDGRTQKRSGQFKHKRPDNKFNKRQLPQEKSMENKTKEINKDTRVDTIEEESKCGGICMFKGTSKLKDYKHIKSKKRVKKNVLTSLLGMYGSDDSNDSESSDSETDREISEHMNLDEESPKTVVENVPEINKPDLERNSDVISLINIEPEKNLCTPPENIPAANILDSASTEKILKICDQKIPIETLDSGPLLPPATESEKLDHLQCEQIEYQNIPRETQNSAPLLPPVTESEKIDHVQHKQNEDQNIPRETLDSTPQLLPATSEKLDNLQSTQMEESLTNSDDEAPEEVAIARTSDLPVASTEPSTSGLCKKDKDKGPPQKRAKLEVTTKVLPARKRQQKSALNYRQRLRKQNTLLEKLLETDIRHERNVLLQCIRYVCQNKFFGVGGGVVAKT